MQKHASIIIALGTISYFLFFRIFLLSNFQFAYFEALFHMQGIDKVVIMNALIFGFHILLLFALIYVSLKIITKLFQRFVKKEENIALSVEFLKVILLLIVRFSVSMIFFIINISPR